MTSADQVMTLAKIMDENSKIWEKWAALSDEISHLKEMGENDKAWCLLLETAMKTDPEFVNCII